MGQLVQLLLRKDPAGLVRVGSDGVYREKQDPGTVEVPLFPKQLHEKDLLSICCAEQSEPIPIVYHILEYKKPNNVEKYKKFPGKFRWEEDHRLQEVKKEDALCSWL